MIHAASRMSLAEVIQRLNNALPGYVQAGASERAVSAELYSVAELLTAQPRLRRTVGDPTTDASARGELVSSLLAGKVSAQAAELAAAAVASRWSSPWDLVDSLEILAADLQLAAAERAGELDRVEDELFRFERILQSSDGLAVALDQANVAVANRQQLIDTLLSGKTSPITVDLLKHAVASTRKRSIVLAIDDLLQASSARRARSVARVISAAPLSDQQVQRLGSALSRLYGRTISVRQALDETVLGGLEIRVGDEVIDGTIASRLVAARNALAG